MFLLKMIIIIIYDDNNSIFYKIYLHVKDPYEAKYQYLIKTLNNKKDFIKYSNDFQDVYENIEECNLNRQ